MRKIEKKLRLNRETVMPLEGRTLATVQGAADDTYPSTIHPRSYSCNSVCQCTA